MDHADAQNLAKPPFMRICREFENWHDLRALSRKFLRQKSCYPESFRFLRLCPSPKLARPQMIKKIPCDQVVKIKRARERKRATLQVGSPPLILAEVPVRAQPGLRGEDLQRIPTINKHRFSRFFPLPIDSHNTSHERLTRGSGLNHNFSSNILVLLIALDISSAI